MEDRSEVGDGLEGRMTGREETGGWRSPLSLYRNRACDESVQV